MSEENTPVTKKYYDYISVGNRTKQTAYFVQQHDKKRMFEELLQALGDKQVLVLVKSKRSADELVENFKEKGLNALGIHGNHRSSQIEEAQVTFNSKEISILITTDRILEALSLTDVAVLVNYDLPFEASDYFKRLRLVDEIGESISLIDPDEERMLATVELMMKCEMIEVQMPDFKHTPRTLRGAKDMTKKPRHKKVEQRAKRKAEIKSKWVPTT